MNAWFDNLLQQARDLGDLVGANDYVQALAVAATFVILGKLADWIISRVVVKLVSRSSNNFDDGLVALLHRPIFISFLLVGAGLAGDILPLPESAGFLLAGVLKTIAIFVWFRFFSGVTNLITVATSRRNDSALVQTGMLALVQNVAKVLLFALGVYFVFLSWDINLGAWLASAGIIGLALSFAARDTLSNLFAGVSIVADAPYKAGDYIIIDSGERGVVTHIGLRSTRLLTRDDVEITIPNGVIGNSKIINEAGGPSEKHRIRIKVGVAYGSDADQVIAVLEKVASDHEEVCEEPTPRVRFRQFGDWSLEFELLCWIDKPVDRGRLSHELHCAVYRAFSDNGIQIPFPQYDVHMDRLSTGD